MPQKFQQTQTQTQTQQFSTLQVALAGLVELPIADLADRVRNELVDNAALEEADGSRDDDADDTRNDEEGDGTPDEEWGNDESGEIRDSLSDYMDPDDIPSYLQEKADAAQGREVPLIGGSSAYDDLVKQIGEHELDEHESEVMVYLIGSLDNDGFLRKDLGTLADELAIYHNVMTSEEELTRLLAVLQTFEPAGIGARSLQECLRLQLADADNRSPYRKKALEVVNRCFNDFTAKRWDVISQRLGFDEETAAQVRRVLTHLNPSPGSQLGSGAMASAPTVIPDFIVTVGRDGLPDIELNNGDVPELRVSRAFRDSIRQYANQRGKLNREQHDAYVYARQKVESAQTFIGLITRRRETLMAVMTAIVEMQRDFFVEEDDESLLRPLALKEVAAHAGVNNSTVSRVVNSKYVQTDYGIYPLKFFFSSQFTTESGDEMSARQIRGAIREIVDTEDKQHPLSDEAITAELAKRKLVVARRTVAKYREQLGILSARMRRG